MKKSKILLKDVGEFGLIESLRKGIRTDHSVRLGIGDDTAILKADPRKEILFTTDMLIEGGHFKLSEATAFQIGWKAMAVNISDIAAMGGLPTHAVVALGLPKNLPVSFVKNIYKGMNAVARLFKVNIVGGDTNQSDKLVIAVSLLGEVDKGGAVKRQGARPGDIVFVTGFLGGSYVSKKHLTFTPRVKESQFLVSHFKVSAMIDVSDGLASDIRRIAEESGVGFVLSKEAIPVSRHAKSLEQALTEGEDFELLFTLPAREASRLTAHTFTEKLVPFHPIGKVVKKRFGIRLVRDDRKSQPLLSRGFDHFK